MQVDLRRSVGAQFIRIGEILAKRWLVHHKLNWYERFVGTKLHYPSYEETGHVSASLGKRGH